MDALSVISLAAITLCIGMLTGLYVGRSQFKEDAAKRGLARFHPVTKYFQWRNGDAWEDDVPSGQKRRTDQTEGKL